MSKIDSRVALDELLLSKEKREALVSSVKRLANDVTALKSKQDIYKEVLGMPSAKLNQFIKAYNDDLESVLGELSLTVDVLEILNEGVN